MAKTPKPVGRPSLYVEELADEICDRLIEGESMRTICADPHMPDRRTVLRWMDAREDFATSIARARAFQADYMDDLILETAMGCTSETSAADRVRIDAFKWRASKLQPKKYGDKVQVAGPGQDGEHQVNTKIEMTIVDPRPV